MPSLHISKVAVGCRTFDALRKRQESRLRDGFVPIVTRFKPTRADELIGGSIFWIIKHRLAARQTILGFAEGEDRRTIIRLAPELVAVRALPKRAHQGWRYLKDKDKPADLGDGEDIGDVLPGKLMGKLNRLGLV